MGVFRPGAHGLNCERCGVDLHGEQEVERGLCDSCAVSKDRSGGSEGTAGERWVYNLLGDVRALPEYVAREALRAPKPDLPQEVVDAVEALVRWRLNTPSDRDDRA